MKYGLTLCALLFALSAHAAEPDPRLARIAERRQLFMLQSQNAELAFRVAQLELEKLEREEAAIRAEKPKDDKKVE